MAVLLLLLAQAAPEFVDVAEVAGLKGVTSGRAVFVDLDADGLLDVVLDKRHFFLQRDGRFEPTEGLSEAADLVLFADFDNDGDADCFAGAYCEPLKPAWKDHARKNRLYESDGKGGWKARELSMDRTTVVAACTLDFDRDGKLDLYVGSAYTAYGQSLQAYPDRLLRGKGDGSFLDVTRKSGLLTMPAPGRRESSKPTYGLTHGDWNGDGWQDLWVATYGRQWNFLWANRSGREFSDVAEQTGFDGDEDRSGKYPEEVKRWFREQRKQERRDELPFRSNGNTFDIAIADYDNDGDMDCILAEITHSWAGPSSDRTSLLVNLGREQGHRFERLPDAFPRERASATSWNQGDLHAGWLDYDNDGLLDALIASSDYPDRQELKLYRQKPDHTFEEPRTFDWEGAGQISVGDFDDDGDLDILAGRSLARLSKAKREELGASCALFRNEVGNANHWLSVVCRGDGKRSNRDGIGCRVRVTTPDGVVQTREIRGGLGHAGHNGPYRAHFGLGRNDRADRVEVTWPDRKGTVTVKEGVPADRRIAVAP